MRDSMGPPMQEEEQNPEDRPKIKLFGKEVPFDIQTTHEILKSVAYAGDAKSALADVGSTLEMRTNMSQFKNPELNAIYVLRALQLQLEGLRNQPDEVTTEMRSVNDALNKQIKYWGTSLRNERNQNLSVEEKNKLSDLADVNSWRQALTSG